MHYYCLCLLGLSHFLIIIQKVATLVHTQHHISTYVSRVRMCMSSVSYRRWFSLLCHTQIRKYVWMYIHTYVYTYVVMYICIYMVGTVAVIKLYAQFILHFFIQQQQKQKSSQKFRINANINVLWWSSTKFVFSKRTPPIFVTINRYKIRLGTVNIWMHIHTLYVPTYF